MSACMYTRDPYYLMSQPSHAFNLCTAASCYDERPCRDKDMCASGLSMLVSIQRVRRHLLATKHLSTEQKC